MELPLTLATPDQLPKDPGIGAGGIKGTWPSAR